MCHILTTLLLLITTTVSAQETPQYIEPFEGIDIRKQDTLIDNLCINNHDTFAVFNKANDPHVNFYKRLQGKLIPKGSFKTTNAVARIDLVDLNADSTKEILIGTGNNLYMNRMFDVFIYDKKGDSIVWAGSMTTHYQVDTAHKIVTSEFLDSWYMGQFKTIYKWYDNKLIPEQQVVKGPINGSTTRWYFEYYINFKHTPNGLIRMRRQNWDVNNEIQQNLWENFFIYK